MNDKLDRALELLATKKINESLNDTVGKLTKDPKNLRQMYLLFLSSHTPSSEQKLKLVEKFINEANYEDENGALTHQMKITVNSYFTKKREQWKELILTKWMQEEYEEVSDDRVRSVCRKAREKKHFKEEEAPAVYDKELSMARDFIQRYVAGEIAPRHARAPTNNNRNY